MPGEYGDFVQRLKRENAPFPSVDPDYLRKLWKHMGEMEALVSITKTFGLGALAGLGIDPAAISPEQILCVMLRLGILRSLSKTNVLCDFMVDDEFGDKVFQAAATLACNSDDVGEALIQMRLRELPEDSSAQLRAELMANGYDPNQPAIDGKFLNWMQDQRT
ncbi:MAG TPA: hypothetical protein VG498_09505 [Terriglobales bacterium]|nr:hypothetical protein [Terriglobales bacterium]